MVFFEYSDDKISRTTSMNMNIHVKFNHSL